MFAHSVSFPHSSCVHLRLSHFICRRILILLYFLLMVTLAWMLLERMEEKFSVITMIITLASWLDSMRWQLLCLAFVFYHNFDSPISSDHIDRWKHPFRFAAYFDYFGRPWEKKFTLYKGLAITARILAKRQWKAQEIHNICHQNWH